MIVYDGVIYVVMVDSSCCMNLEIFSCMNQFIITIFFPILLGSFQ